MSVMIKKGRRGTYGNFYIGHLEAKLLPRMKKTTLEEIGEQLFKQMDMTKGEVELLHIAFKFEAYE